MNKKFISILLSILLPVFLVGAVVYATTSVGTNISVEGDLDILGTDLQATTGTLNISKSGSMTTVKGTLNVDEAVTLDSTIAVTGTSTLATTTITKLTVSGATALNGGLTMDSTAFTIADTTGNTAIAGTLNVTGDFVVNNKATTTASTGDFATQGDIDIVGQDLQKTTGVLNISKSGSMTTVKGTLNVDEAVTLDSTIAVTGTSTLATTTATKLSVSGATALGDGTTINKVLFGTCSIDPGNLGIRGVSTSTVATNCTADGVVAGDKVFVTPTDLEYGVVFHNATSSADVISISVTNLKDAELDPAASNWDWMAIR